MVAVPCPSSTQECPSSNLGEEDRCLNLFAAKGQLETNVDLTKVTQKTFNY